MYTFTFLAFASCAPNQHRQIVGFRVPPLVAVRVGAGLTKRPRSKTRQRAYRIGTGAWHSYCKSLRQLVQKTSSRISLSLQDFASRNISILGRVCMPTMSEGRPLPESCPRLVVMSIGRLAGFNLLASLVYSPQSSIFHPPSPLLSLSARSPTKRRVRFVDPPLHLACLLTNPPRRVPRLRSSLLRSLPRSK